MSDAPEYIDANEPLTTFIDQTAGTIPDVTKATAVRMFAVEPEGEVERIAFVIVGKEAAGVATFIANVMETVGSAPEQE